MSLRLDPKYHGVRVARVRPKESTLTPVTNGEICSFADLWVNDSSFLQFRKFKGLNEWEPRVIFAYINNAAYYRDEIFQALEALGLR